MVEATEAGATDAAATMEVAAMGEEATGAAATTEEAGTADGTDPAGDTAVPGAGAGGRRPLGASMSSTGTSCMVSIPQRDLQLGVSTIDVVPKARLGVRAILKTRRPCGLQPCASRANGP